MAEAAGAGNEPPVAWVTGVEVAPIELPLRTRIEPIMNSISRDNGVPAFFQALYARDPPIETVGELRDDITQPELLAIQRRTIKLATLNTLAKLLDPEGYEWRPDPSEIGKRKRGGNGNNKARLTLEEQLELESVEPLDSDTFRWGPDVFDGIPKKGSGVSLNKHVDKLFDNTWLAMSKVLRPPTPAHAHASVHIRSRAPSRERAIPTERSQTGRLSRARPACAC